MRKFKREIDASSRVTAIDEINPEDVAMLQALLARSSAPVESHLERLERTGSGNFMRSYYVGYNHKSIGDCGTTTLFFEGVSMLAAKAIQDWPLYSGQETSTRAVDFSKARVVDPLGSDASREMIARLVSFTIDHRERVEEHTRQLHPIRDGEDPKAYARAVEARAFDILRGFIPAGACTQLSWHTNLRQAGDHLSTMRYHPLAEVRRLAHAAGDVLREAYPSSGGSLANPGLSGEALAGDRALALDGWDNLVGSTAYTAGFADANVVGSFSSTISRDRLEYFLPMLASRPRGGVLPHFLSDLGQVTFRPLVDFGSFRDIQRHRNGVCRMPRLECRGIEGRRPREGSGVGMFEPWYVDSLPAYLRRAAADLVEDAALTYDVARAKVGVDEAQNLVPMGCLVRCCLTYGLPAAVYVAELRTAKTVHPTARRLATDLAMHLGGSFPEVQLHLDLDPDDWTVRRGKQTIEARP